MSIYLVINERNEEVSAYSNMQRAESTAIELETATEHQYHVEELFVNDDRQVALA